VPDRRGGHPVTHRVDRAKFGWAAAFVAGVAIVLLGVVAWIVADSNPSL
jgi:hypothetical protein